MQSLFYIASVLQFYQQMKHVFVSSGIRHCVVCCVSISIWEEPPKELKYRRCEVAGYIQRHSYAYKQTVIDRNFFDFIFKNTLDFSLKFYGIYYVFIILLLGIIFTVFYQVDYEEAASYIAQFSFTCFYPLPGDGRMNNDRNMPQRNNNRINAIYS